MSGRPSRSRILPGRPGPRRGPGPAQHLKVLRQAGLVRTRRRGTQICYSIDPGGIGAAAATIAALRPPAVADTA
jgi:ArsR family transcriptional regulator, arsenate/arsenite/antimonite-responsive transcriptional repressor